MAHAFDVVDDFEAMLAAYTGAPHVVTVDSCTNALFLSLLWHRDHHTLIRGEVGLPRRTYVGVAHAVRNAGFKIRWEDYDWEGTYQLGGTCVFDAAKRFTSRMYVDLEKRLMCVSFQAYKILPIGRGGAVLTDDAETALWLRRARFDGRDRDDENNGHVPGFHMYLDPPSAARGLWLLRGLSKDNPDLPNDHVDISQYQAFKAQ
jgi:dTDP-4-amino-4,6-dideoxygalactose transaminase